MLPAGDAELIQIVNHELADATVRGGKWLACRPGCDQCCTGVFRISTLDVERIRAGLAALTVSELARADAIRVRVKASVETLSPDYPGDVETGMLYDDEDSVELFSEFADEAVCPVLDPATGTCDLYAARPMTCRTFGPPVRLADESYGVCELCFVGAPATAIAEAEMYPPPAELEAALTAEAGPSLETVVAFALNGY
jgi:Fe-S-cluster containining protein